MKDLTIAEIRAGAPSEEWAEVIAAESAAPTDRWRRESGGTPRCFRSAHDRAEWERGAWCAVRGDPDTCRTVGCAFRQGYDWAARRALESGGWEAWNLALREVEERRAICRSSPEGVRYYAPRADPPADLATNTVAAALWQALHGMQGAFMRWSIYRQTGVSDADLCLAVSREFGTVSAGEVAGLEYRGEGCRLFNDHNGGREPRFLFGPYSEQRKFSGPALVAKARAVLRLPAPGQLTLDAWSGVWAPDGRAPTAHPTGHAGIQEAEQLALF